jgi:hypothetical protein
MLGYGEGELTGKPLSAVTDCERAAWNDVSWKDADDSPSQATERIFLNREGAKVHTETGSARVRFKGKQIVWLSVHDITDRKQAEEALRRANMEWKRASRVRTAELSEANRRLKSDVEERMRVEAALRNEEKHSSDVFRRDSRHDYRHRPGFPLIHSTGARIRLCPPNMGRQPRSVMTPSILPGETCETVSVFRCLYHRKTVCREKINPVSGSLRYALTQIFDDMGQVHMVVEHAANITDGRKMKSDGLVQKRIGGGAGGNRHDFNNLLTSVMGNIYLARLLLSGGEAAPPPPPEVGRS